MAVLAGFGVVRFLKSSANDAERPDYRHTGSDRFGGGASNLSSAVNRGYRDEFSK
jgi:hypothetical protein